MGGAKFLYLKIVKKITLCCKYALFISKNTFFPLKTCIFAFFVVPLQRTFQFGIWTGVSPVGRIVSSGSPFFLDEVSV